MTSWIHQCGGFFVFFRRPEACFFVKLTKSSSNKLGVQVNFRYSISIHSRDILLFKKIKKYLGVGSLSIRTNIVELVIRRLSDLDLKIIPLFEKYPIQGVKALDYVDFLKVAAIMKVNCHNTKEGLAKIRDIKSGMNTKRNDG
jgi:hypothetical protein